LIYLLLHIVFASAFTLIIKWSQQRKVDDVVVGAINYIAAAVVTLPAFLMVNPMPVDVGAIWTGGAMGAVYFTAYFLVIRAIRMVGASATSVVAVLSILFPIVLAAIFFSERPTPLQSIGIGLALGSLVLVGRSKQAPVTNTKPASLKKHLSESHSPETDISVAAWIVPLVLATFFFLCGLNRVAQDLFKHVSHPDHRPAFCLAAFTIASIPSFYVLLLRKRWPTAMETGIGFLLGLSNVLQTYFMLRSLEHLAGYIAFTIASGGTIVFTTMMAVGLMGERINRKTQIGIGLAVVALVMLKWLPE
jgi:drug/metabolite transporter (DMT)-like permease